MISQNILNSIGKKPTQVHKPHSTVRDSVELVAIARLKPHERFSSVRVKYLVHKIASERIWTSPILIDRATNVILDGHHRHQAALALGLRAVPCVPVNYLHSKAITVAPRRARIPVTKQVVLKNALTNRVFPYKTTRHTSSVALPRTRISIARLMPKQRDRTRL